MSATLQLDAYRRVLGVPAVRRVVLLSFVLRAPLWASSIALTLHVVQTLHSSYARAGFLSAVSALALAISAPWRGRLLDRVGLRKVVAPSALLTLSCWSVGPWLPYWPLFGIAMATGLFMVPQFSIMRMALLAVTHDDDRRTVLSVDSVAAEITFMVGPLLGVWLASILGTAWTIFSCEMAAGLAAAVLWWMNPRLLKEEEADPAAAPIARREWATPALFAVLAAGVASTIVLTGTDLGLVAALRATGDQSRLGVVMAVWGGGSMLGGLVYGALHRSWSAFVLLVGLCLSTIPLGFVHGPLVLSVFAFVAGVLCAPTLTAVVEQLTRAVPSRAQGEAMGWHGSAMTGGSALGSPIAGIALDRWGPPGGFLLVCLLGLAAAAGGGSVWRARRPRPETDVRAAETPS